MNHVNEMNWMTCHFICLSCSEYDLTCYKIGLYEFMKTLISVSVICLSGFSLNACASV